MQCRPKPQTAYDTAEGTLASWDVQFRCQQSLQGRGQLDQELYKIFAYYFPQAVEQGLPSLGQCEDVKQHASVKGCSLLQYWEFWSKIDFFQGPYRDSPPYWINKSFAVGSGMQRLFEDFSRENSKGLQLKMGSGAVLLSFEGWRRAVSEMGRLALGQSAVDAAAAASKFVHQVILPSCAREQPNPVFTHFKRAEVSSLLDRYRAPLLKLYHLFRGTCPNVHVKLTPQPAPSGASAPATPEPASAGATPEPGGAEWEARESLRLGQGINVEEFLLFCRCMRVCPALVDELSLRYIFAHANCGWDSDHDPHHLSFSQPPPLLAGLPRPSRD